MEIDCVLKMGLGLCFIVDHLLFPSLLKAVFFLSTLSPAEVSLKVRAMIHFLSEPGAIYGTDVIKLRRIENWTTAAESWRTELCRGSPCVGCSRGATLPNDDRGYVGLPV
jgi:hypothetical protein